jgi:hypothetical protein
VWSYKKYEGYYKTWNKCRHLNALQKYHIYEISKNVLHMIDIHNNTRHIRELKGTLRLTHNRSPIYSTGFRHTECSISLRTQTKKRHSQPNSAVKIC